MRHDDEDWKAGVTRWSQVNFNFGIAKAGRQLEIKNKSRSMKNFAVEAEANQI